MRSVRRGTRRALLSAAAVPVVAVAVLGAQVQLALRESTDGGMPYAVEHRIMHPERGVR